ncbi:unnamed protein product [Notodromas monacha]|uniref:Period circadian protein n=1 Tax=Notodromas monacha TaxID=399045 RepID=A0A7R9BBU9_9CRUS|nr:unnamed protein product [Notodromas monacha]CAG0912324.1 unnamed protein product [Notodromas monacha]
MKAEDDQSKAVSALADSGYGGTCQSKSADENSSNSADNCSRSGTGSSGSDHLGTACSSAAGTKEGDTPTTPKKKIIYNPFKIPLDDAELHSGAAEIFRAAQLALKCLKNLASQDFFKCDSAKAKANAPIVEDSIPINASEEGCSLLVSLQTMCVVQASPTTKDTLGFSEQMLCSRSFLDYIYPRDRFAFTSEVTSIMRALGEGKLSPEICTFYIRVRGFKTLEIAGFDVKTKRTIYKPFHGTMQIKVVKPEPEHGKDISMEEPEYYTLLKLVPIKSAYEEGKDPIGSFGTRHTSSCHLSHVDPAAIPFLGYLPQDLIGNSIFEYYHPEDLSYLKKDFESVLQRSGATCSGARSRFRAHNGCYLVLSTDWSCFVNPWTCRLEFVIGQHKVVETPSNSNVFLIPKETDALLSDKVLQDTSTLQEEILAILSKNSTSVATDANTFQKDITRVNNVIPPTEEKKADNSGPDQRNSSSAQESALIGHVSPLHEEHEGSRSNTSGSSITTYNQLNYRESILRFFQSQQKAGGVTEYPSRNNSVNRMKHLPFESNALSTDEEVNAMDSVSNIHSKKNSHNESSSNNVSHVSSSNEIMEMGTSVSKNSLQHSMQQMNHSSDHSERHKIPNVSPVLDKPQEKANRCQQFRQVPRCLTAIIPQKKPSAPTKSQIPAVQRVVQPVNPLPEHKGCLTQETLQKHTKTESKLFVKQHRPVRPKPARRLTSAPPPDAVQIISAATAAVVAGKRNAITPDMDTMDDLIDRVSRAYMRHQYNQQGHQFLHQQGHLVPPAPRIDLAQTMQHHMHSNQSTSKHTGHLQDMDRRNHRGVKRPHPDDHTTTGGCGRSTSKRTCHHHGMGVTHRGMEKSFHQGNMSYYPTGNQVFEIPQVPTAYATPQITLPIQQAMATPLTLQPATLQIPQVYGVSANQAVVTLVPGLWSNQSDPIAVHSQGHHTITGQMNMRTLGIHSDALPSCMTHQSSMPDTPLEGSHTTSLKAEPGSGKESGAPSPLQFPKDSDDDPEEMLRCREGTTYSIPEGEFDLSRKLLFNSDKADGDCACKQHQCGSMHRLRSPPAPICRLSDSVALPGSSSFRHEDRMPPRKSQTKRNEQRMSRKQAPARKEVTPDSTEDTYSFSLSDGSSVSKRISSGSSGSMKPKRTNLPPWMEGVEFDESTAFQYTMPMMSQAWGAMKARNLQVTMSCSDQQNDAQSVSSAESSADSVKPTVGLPH